MQWRWLLGVPLVLAAGGCSALMVFAHVEAGELYDHQRRDLSEALEKHADAFRADLRVASALPAFDPVRPMKADAKDAASFLAKHVPFRTADGPSVDSAVPASTAKAINAVAIGKFPQRALEIDVQKADLSWMRELASFDRWELLEEKPVGFHTMPLPDASALEAIARVRLVQGVLAKDAMAGARDVEELARLLATTEHPEVVRHVPTLLQLVRHTFEHARAEGLDIETWTPAPARVERVRAVKRALAAYTAALDFHVDDVKHRALLDELLTSPELHVGRCAALNHVATTVLEVAPVGGERYDAARAWIARALEQTKGTCRLVVAREAWASPEEQRALVVGTDAMCNAAREPADCVVASIFGTFPGIRDALIEASTADAADAFAAYAGGR